MIFKRITTLSDSQLQKLITFFGILIALQITYIQHGWVNDDSILYFEMARLFSIGEWKQGIELFNWPFYPLLISAVHQTTHLAIQTSAQVLNILFFAITTFSYISLIRLAGGNKATIICGAFLLLSSSYIVGDVLAMLLRDQGFWAMFLTSLVYFIQFYRNKKISDALFWQLSAIAAVLFRIEAISYLIGLPLILLLRFECSFKQNITDLFRVNLIPICTLLLIVGVLIFMPSIHLSDFGRLQEAVTIFPRMLTEIAHMFKLKASIMGEMVLGEYFHNYGMMGIMLTLIAIVIFNVITLISWPVMGVFALSKTYEHQQPVEPTIQQDTRKIFYWAITLSLLNAWVIITSVFVLSGRYLIALVFIMLIFAAFQMASLIKFYRTTSDKKRWGKALLFILLALICFFGIKNLLPKPSNYIFEQNAVAYIKKQNIQNNEVFYVTPRSRYYADAPYAGRGYDYWQYTKKAIENGSIYQFNYLMINVNIDEKLPERQKILSENLPQYKIIKEFYGYRNKKKIMLYMKNH